jgi:hypothetical protein
MELLGYGLRGGTIWHHHIWDGDKYLYGMRASMQGMWAFYEWSTHQHTRKGCKLQDEDSIGRIGTTKTSTSSFEWRQRIREGKRGGNFNLYSFDQQISKSGPKNYIQSLQFWT